MFGRLPPRGGETRAATVNKKNEQRAAGARSSRRGWPRATAARSPRGAGQTCFPSVNPARVHRATARFASPGPINQINAGRSASRHDQPRQATFAGREPTSPHQRFRDRENLNEIHRNIAPNAALV
jgi:hypothetical protein